MSVAADVGVLALDSWKTERQEEKILFGLPFSLVFRAEPGKEDTLLQSASAYEAASQRRVPPPAFAPLAGT